MLLDKYKPTTQKTLFHKDIANHILKWIKQIKELIEDKKSVKKILFLCGPIGCGKSITIEILFKTFQLININSDYIRTTDKMNELISNIVAVDSMTLSNIEKWNHSNRKEKYNIVFVDNIELCDKSIQTFIELVHNKYNINVPIIIISNTNKYMELFNETNCTFIEFKKPSLLEMTKLGLEINDTEKLGLSKANLKLLIDRSESDIRQMIFLLEQLKLKVTGQSIKDIDLDNFFNSVQVKITDIDLVHKLEYLLDINKEFDLEHSFNLSFSEPQTISCGIYQNYLNNADNLEQCINIIDDISYSSLINYTIFDNQLWDLYEDYTMYSCVLPSYNIKHNYIKKDKTVIQPYKDISYNFLNSYNEVKRIYQDNIVLFNKKIYNKCDNNYKDNIIKLYTFMDPKLCFHITNMCKILISNMNKYFDKNKKGKNTTKKEKFDLCDSIIGEKEEKDLDDMVDILYSYKLFEVDLDWIILHKKSMEDIKNIKENVNKIDLRVFKRLLNIFTMDDNQKILKSHTENALQYKILQHILYDLKKLSGTVIKDNYIDNLTIELDQIWNL